MARRRQGRDLRLRRHPARHTSRLERAFRPPSPPALSEQAKAHRVEDLDEDDEVDELPEEVHELLERIDLLRNAVADLRLNAEDPLTAA